MPQPADTDSFDPFLDLKWSRLSNLELIQPWTLTPFPEYSQTEGPKAFSDARQGVHLGLAKLGALPIVKHGPLSTAWWARLLRAWQPMLTYINDTVGDAAWQSPITKNPSLLPSRLLQSCAEGWDAKWGKLPNGDRAYIYILDRLGGQSRDDAIIGGIHGQYMSIRDGRHRLLAAAELRIPVVARVKRPIS